MNWKNVILEEEYKYLTDKKTELEEDLKKFLKESVSEGLNLGLDDGIPMAWLNEIIHLKLNIIKNIDETLKNTTVLKDSDLEKDNKVCAIWSIVELIYFEEKSEKRKNIKVKICWKNLFESENGIRNISYKSPVWKSILWLQVWDDFKYEVNWKIFTWEIVSITN